ncbi:hypothetical protein AXX17_AT3G24510 [Arabidopsis thaliana]|uniref:Uncharacterized protein n=1 Tax=Arabidopsis thaliana TaxID=3702 RepID=A0A178VBF8_ARATH|nr:hypothetical protein AXX17_AT3G24510 [Arabidopsis thaliana]
MINSGRRVGVLGFTFCKENFLVELLAFCEFDFLLFLLNIIEFQRYFENFIFNIHVVLESGMSEERVQEQELGVGVIV